MDNFKSFDEVIDFAIAREAESADFYASMSKRMTRPEMKEVFTSFSAEELGHKKKLEAIKRGDYSFPAVTKVTDMRIADYSVEGIADNDTDYREALLLAMQKEKISFKLYSDLARASTDPSSRNLFLGLAQEEAKHKLRFEIEYDEYVLKDN